ncbi:enamine deaminase RidA, YjgF/YER057c/UK114 family [Paludibacter jiangxiensis]|uniref:Enamine deaminase RidA, YjgF/YER057c/UK114 family n=1 Tax=Paludibacter jiangxiensis TaxID=681398 RepID=A0A170YIU0_9BACT|nr:enamine deaminase RidA, YjgF/YER057c/UK114 family [Paludibacter jiangxiensis]
MNYSVIRYDDLSVKATCSIYRKPNQAAVLHAILELTESAFPAGKQFDCLHLGMSRILSESAFRDVALVWKRYFVSDVANQAEYLPAGGDEAVSLVQQPPLSGSKVVLWLCGIENVSLGKMQGNGTLVKRPHYSHVFHAQLHEQAGTVEQQTKSVFDAYGTYLNKLNACLESNCIRTWLFVKDVDRQYAGMVTARKTFFEKENLTLQTHYIASTGIEGRHIHPEVLVLMDAYAVLGLKKEQIQYLKGSSHLNSTSEYGVTFERGTAVLYGDRCHVYISGTASIDNNGDILYLRDIEKQTARVLENISVLLEEAGCDMKDVAHLLIYLRDVADYAFVHSYMQAHYPSIPKVILLAPVCRPGWLIEIECVAIKEMSNPQFYPF